MLGRGPYVRERLAYEKRGEPHQQIVLNMVSAVNIEYGEHGGGGPRTHPLHPEPPQAPWRPAIKGGGVPQAP